MITIVLNNITLINGDCMEALKSFPDNSYDLAIVDPPYGINMGKKHTGPGWVTRESKSWDFERPGINYFSELRRVSKNQIIWGGNYFADLLPASMGWIFWDKGQRNFSLADGELAWTSFNRALRVFEFSRAKCMAEVNGHKIHPTQKPIALYKWLLLNYTRGGEELILDTHLGSGSIAIAADDMGYKLTGIELDPEYYEAAKNRLKEHQRQLKLF
jgi:site-specific DNA-methyltransferase (adenine-specific)